jgi:GTP-binding protein HflX
VGYTNAGKTSLMNALTDAGLLARDRPFETLDTTSRCLTRHGGDVLLSDTVGFIRRLPERLLASFESTLAEVAEASLLVVVVDASDPEAAHHLDTTDDVLERIGAAEIPRLVVFNKLDRVSEPQALSPGTLAGGYPYVALSSHDAGAVADLREQLLSRVRAHHRQAALFVPYALHGLTRDIHAHCRIHEAHASERGTRYLVEGEPHVIDRLQRELRRSR